MTDEPVGFSCPGCGRPPFLVLAGGRQAFCETTDCHVLSWDPTKSVADLAEDAQWIDTSEIKGPPDGPPTGSAGSA